MDKGQGHEAIQRCMAHPGFLFDPPKSPILSMGLGPCTAGTYIARPGREGRLMGGSRARVLVLAAVGVFSLAACGEEELDPNGDRFAPGVDEIVQKKEAPKKDDC